MKVSQLGWILALGGVGMVLGRWIPSLAYTAGWPIVAIGLALVMFGGAASKRSRR